MFKKALGTFYGQLIGDALGCRYEFMNITKTKESIQKDRDGKGFLPILGGGPFEMKPGQVTDDSEMALSMLGSLCRCGTYDQADVACSYVAWIQSSPPDVGHTTRTALSIPYKLPENWQSMHVNEKLKVLQTVLKNVEKKNENSLSNGCLMRISPLAIVCSKIQKSSIEDFVKKDVLLTHCHPICTDVCVAYCVAIHVLLNGGAPEEAFDEAYAACEENVTQDILDAAKSKPTPVRVRGADINGDTTSMGYIGVALQSAFYELLHASSFENGLISAISRGGDTDTNGAIVGALLGAKFGHDNIPAEWIKKVEDSEVRFPSLGLMHASGLVVDKLLQVQLSE